MTAAIIFVMLIIVGVTSFFSYTYGRDNARAELALKIHRLKVAHLDSLKRVHDTTLVVAKTTTGPAQMRDAIARHLVIEMERVNK